MLQVAFDAAAEAMLIIDMDRRIHWANQASASLLVEGVPIQVTNRSLDALVSFRLEDGKPLAEDHALHPNQGLPRVEGQGRFQLQLATGSRTVMQEVRWQPVFMIQAPLHHLITIRDLSPEQLALQQQLRFMTDLTHELRTPLTIVSGSLRRLQREDDLKPRVRQHLNRAGAETTRIHRLLEHLSLMTRLEIDPAWLGVADHPLLSLLDQWLNRCPEAIRRRIRLESDVPIQTTTVRVDANALEIVLDQLLDNAIGHGADNQSVLLQARCCAPEAGAFCALSLTSFGLEDPVGPDALQAWLQPFVQGLRHRESKRQEGSGLGLALVRQLVNGWGGELALDQRVEADRLGLTATRIRFTVPLSQQRQSQESPAAAETDRA